MRNLILGFALAAAISAPALAQAPPKPNQVIIVIDDAADVAGMPWTKENIADQGVSINRFITNTPLCGPSRALTLRGQYAHSTHIYQNTDSAKFYGYKYGPSPTGPISVPQTTIESDTVVTRLKAVGYRTGHFGKYLNGWGSTNITGPFPPNPPGWDVHMATVLNGPDGSNGDTAWNYFRVIKNGALYQDFTTANGRGYEPYEVLKHSVSFIRTTPASQPLFMMVHARIPHSPSTPFPGDEALPVPPLFYPPSYNEPSTVPHIQSWLASTGVAVPFVQGADDYVRAQKEKRYRAMLYVDEMVRTLHDEMIAAGRDDSSTFYFMFSDNGWMEGEHGLPSGKGLAYRESVSNTPLWVKGPQVWPHVEDERIASTADLAPTWLRIAGLPPAPYMEGRALQPLLWNNQAPAWRTAILAENWQAFYWVSIETDDRWKLVVWQDDGYLELYDEVADPWERNNLAYVPAYASTVAQLRYRIPAYKACTGAVQCQTADAAYVTGSIPH